ncbi:hypothetical protein [Streptomyces sp. NPDC003032]
MTTNVPGFSLPPARLPDVERKFAQRLTGFLLYLANEGVMTVDGEHVTLCSKARAYAEFRSWYTFLVGGCATTAGQAGQALRRGSALSTRNGRDVGVGSCETARYDGMPMTETLLADAGVEPRTILDPGCGDALYLIDRCRRIPGATAWGAEPDPAASKQAQARVEAEGLADREGVRQTQALPLPSERDQLAATNWFD